MMCLHVVVRLCFTTEWVTTIDTWPGVIPDFVELYQAELGWMQGLGKVHGWYAGHRCRVQVPVPDAQTEAHNLCGKVIRCIFSSGLLC